MSFFSRMHNGLSSERVKLARGDIVEIDRASALRIECLEGEIWLTRDRDVEDHFLAAGEAKNFEPARGIVIEALHPAQVLVSAASRSELRARGVLPRLLEPA